MRFRHPCGIWHSCAWHFFFVSSTAWANLLQNGGFGAGDFSDWSVNSQPDYPWSIDSSDAYDGIYDVSTGCVGEECITGAPDQQASLSQTVATNLGEAYTLTFEFSTQGADAPDELDVLWNGDSVLDLGPGGTLGVVSTYTLYTVEVTAASSSSTLTFLGRQDPGFEVLDDVDLEPSDLELAEDPSAPEPSTLLLMSGVLPLIVFVRRRLAR